MALNDLVRWDAKVFVFFSSGSPYIRWNGLTYRTTKLGMVTHVMRGVLLCRSRAVIPRGGAQRPPLFVISYMRIHGMKNSKQILHGNQT